MRPISQPPDPGTNGLAVASLVVGIVGLFFCFGALGIILGNIANHQIAESGQAGRGMATAGIILGILAILWVAVRAILIYAMGNSMSPY